ncbi:F-actin capping protein alpha subunit-domain-containing protein [Phyllosticta citriasiana]|uniref:F-actin-capping protein subunit alpha n=1 Tax=Phyllosticta citriasiana TaxID=595635 RepID=A0ABR1KRE7_9PEZI
MNNNDKSVASSSVGSVNMLGSDSSSDSSGDDDPMDPDDNDDPMIMTPQVLKLDKNLGNPFGGAPSAASPSGGMWSGGFSPNGPNFLQIQRNRLRKVRSRKSSSSASGHSSLASPGPASPPASKAFEGANGGYFAREAVIRKAGSRRESLSVHAKDLNLSSGNDSGDEAGKPAPSTPGVVRRAVTRRGNLLPKSRQFARIRADLFEEGAPVDSEVKREAEIIRQVRESDTRTEHKREGSVTANSSPSLLPTVPGLSELEDIPENDGMDMEGQAVSSGKGLFRAFNLQPTVDGPLSWNGNPDGRFHTPPPPFFSRGGSAISDDINMDSPSVSSVSYSHRMSVSEGTKDQSLSRGSTPQPMVPPTAADGIKKKRRRDDDFDVNSIKRRAVSPGLSVTNSPVMSQSPQQTMNNNQKNSREGSTSAPGGHAAGERSNSGGSTMSVTPSLGPKRVGLQGMTDTNDGLMKMSIDSFIESAPPGELSNVTAAIKSITGSSDVSSLSPALQKYNEEQFTKVKLPGASDPVIVSSFNSLGDSRYYDPSSQTSFAFDHVTQQASDAQSHVLESAHADLVKSLLKSLSTHATEHYPAAAVGAYPIESDERIAIVLVSSKYSPNNYWNGRWRSLYVYEPASGKVTGSIKVDVHYYEDGNVRMLTDKPVTTSAGSGGASGADVVKALALAERKYQEDLNRAFGSLSEGAFKGLRRQLPITRQKIEWEKISGYKLGQDIGSGKR